MVEYPPESIRLFGLSEAMKWSILPVAGGIYDQHPDLLLQWGIIWDEKAKYELDQKRKAEQSKGKSKGR